jgi:hypothetical protein
MRFGGAISVKDSTTLSIPPKLAMYGITGTEIFPIIHSFFDLRRRQANSRGESIA